MVTHMTETKPRRKLCFVVSTPMTAIAFLNSHIDHLADEFDITVVCNFDGSESQISQKANLKNIKITRPISALNDAKATWWLYRFLSRENFDIVHSVSPKAGLVAAVSGWLARTPIRIHWFTGQVWVLTKGKKRWLMKSLDKLVAGLNTQLLVDSSSQRQFLINAGVIMAQKSQVLGSGSIAGVDTSRFRPDSVGRASIRNELEIMDPTAKIIIFVGRLTRDKGIDVLFEAFLSGKLHQDPFLVLVGPDEGHYLDKIEAIDEGRRDRLRYIPYTQNPEHFLVAADIFCLPTFREGFGLSIIEASAVGLPVVASNIYGVTDAVEDQITGMLISPGDSAELVTALNRLLSNPEEIRRMGTLGRTKVLKEWQGHRLQTELQCFYQDQINNLARKISA
jgi:glycosyltransferase involved in cell wall biosynthesis